MKGDILPDDGMVIRHVRSGAVSGKTVDGSAFRLKENEEGASVNWLGAFAGDTDAQLSSVREVKRRSFGKNDRLAQLNVGRVRAHLENEWPGISFVHDPLEALGEYPPDPSHSEIMGLPEHGTDDSELLGDLIAECLEDLFPANG